MGQFFISIIFHEIVHVSDFFLQFLKELFNQNAEEENRPKKKA